MVSQRRPAARAGAVLGPGGVLPHLILPAVLGCRDYPHCRLGATEMGRVHARARLTPQLTAVPSGYLQPVPGTPKALCPCDSLSL